MSKVVRIGGACPIDFEGSMNQLVGGGKLDYVIIDFLSEFSLPFLVQARSESPAAGFAPGFVSKPLSDNLGAALAQGLRIVTNAGGLDPEACAAAVARMAEGLGLRPRIATVLGDNLTERAAELLAQGLKDMNSGEPLPGEPASLTAYTGALPVAQALAGGADIVITGRAVDSALALGPLIHEFGWSADDYDRLAAGSVIGHVIECGAQAAGGLFTDWRDVPDWADISFPIAECHADGTAVFTKVEGSGGLVTVGTISEQATYEIGDPQRYYLPDVTCDLTGIRLDQAGPDRVSFSGAKGYPPTSTYKGSAIVREGWRATVSFVLRGLDAAAKAERVAESLLRRTGLQLRARNLGPWRASNVELIGGGGPLGAAPGEDGRREVVCRMVVDHDTREAVDMFLRSQRAVSVGMAPGIATVPLGSSAAPVFRVHSFLLPKHEVALSVKLDGGPAQPSPAPTQGGFKDALVAPAEPLAEAEAPAEETVPLVALAWTRSGDKGDMSNISVIARRAGHLPWIKAALTTEAVGDWFAHLTADGSRPHVVCHELPGLHALNFLLYQVLGGGGSASMRFDPMGKALGQQLLDMPIGVSAALAAECASGRRGGNRPFT